MSFSAAAQTTAGRLSLPAPGEPTFYPGKFLGSIGDIVFDCDGSLDRTCLVVYSRPDGKIDVKGVTEQGEKLLLVASGARKISKYQSPNVTRYMFDDAAPEPADILVPVCGNRLPREPGDPLQTIRCGNDDNAYCFYVNYGMRSGSFDVNGGTATDGKTLFMAETVTSYPGNSGGMQYEFNGITPVKYVP